jgi:hypothetical protein
VGFLNFTRFASFAVYGKPLLSHRKYEEVLGGVIQRMVEDSKLSQYLKC